jgi:subtilisin family serine protease
VQFTCPANTLKSGKDKFREEKYTTDSDPASYGNALTQLTQLNGQFLHNKGYRGKGIQIAVLDGGFWHTNEIASFDSLRLNSRLLGIRDFVDPKSDFYQQATHGMSVLSCMAGNIPNRIIGNAPDAAYYLMRTENVSSEYLVEEDNWVAGAEYADSLGVDVINSSLGYSIFDDPAMNHTYANMDGKTTRVTRAGNMAFRKGILVVTSAGNEGNNVWKKIIAPSDGEGVLGIAAVDRFGVRAGFSSIGPAWGGAIKPNVAAMGLNTYLVTSSGNLGYSNGTSFSSPVLAGMAACLMQANPYASAFLIKSAIEQSAHQFSKPDSLLGFGIPDFEKADQYLKANIIKELVPNKFVKVGPNPFIDQILIHNYSEKINDQLLITISDHRGIRLFQSTFRNDQMIELNHLGGLPEGVLIMPVSNGELKERVKLIKISK